MAIIQADVLEWLKTYDGPKFQAVFCDPPYALISIAERFGKEGSAPAQEEGTDGSFGRLSKGFMGMDWDSWTDLPSYQRWVTSWAKLLIEKAVYPGAIGMFFGGTRTVHRLACGLEEAGWILKDVLSWNYGSGFPKSLSLSKAIDKAAGAEPEPLGISPNWRESKRDRERFGSMEVRGENAGLLTTPATDTAKDWDGWATSLKPGWEPVLLAMAPRGGRTHAQLALEFGTGALWIDGARIGRAENDRFEYGVDGDEGDPRRTVYGKTERIAYTPTPAGRYPSNVLLQHSDGCVRKGTKKVKTAVNAGSVSKPATHVYGDYAGDRAGFDYADADGMEECEDWVCVDGCPVKILDEQAGESSPGHWPKGAVSGYGELGGGTRSYSGQGPKEEGGNVSRFFYTAKADRSEREHGLFGKIPCHKCGLLESLTHKNEKEGDVPCIRNIHPTIKPISITKYLATLLLPPPSVKPRRILVPFAGTGSEMIGALLAGWDEVVGIEREENYVAIANARIPWWLEHPLGEEPEKATRFREQRDRVTKGGTKVLEDFR